MTGSYSVHHHHHLPSSIDVRCCWYMALTHVKQSLKHVYINKRREIIIAKLKKYLFATCIKYIDKVWDLKLIYTTNISWEWKILLEFCKNIF